MVVQVVSQIEFAGLTYHEMLEWGGKKEISLASLALCNMRFKADHMDFCKRVAGEQVTISGLDLIMVYKIPREPRSSSRLYFHSRLHHIPMKSARQDRPTSLHDHISPV
jgi:hypothetical protein